VPDVSFVRALGGVPRPMAIVTMHDRAGDLPHPDHRDKATKARIVIIYDTACGLLRSLQTRVARARKRGEELPADVASVVNNAKFVVDPFHFGSNGPSGGHPGGIRREHVNPHHLACVVQDKKGRMAYRDGARDKPLSINSQACEQGFKWWNRLQASLFKADKLTFKFRMLYAVFFLLWQGLVSCERGGLNRAGMTSLLCV
jgi:hypothetical protein